MISLNLGKIWVITFTTTILPLTVLRAIDNPPSTPPPAPADAASTAYRASIQQESIRGETEKIKKKLEAVVAQLKLNGLSNTQILSVLKASDQLSKLSQEDMQQVLASLQTASNTTESKDQQTAILNAYKSQQALTTKLETLANHVAYQQSQNGVNVRLMQLIRRQSENLRRVEALSAMGASPGQLDASKKNYHQLAVTEQKAISDGIGFLSGDLQNVATAKGVTPAAIEQVKTTLAQLDSAALTGLPKLSEHAAQQTETGPFPDAIKLQGMLKTELIKLLGTWHAKDETAARLAQAREQLDKITKEQKELAEATKRGTEDSKSLADKQNKLEDEAAIAKEMLQTINPNSSNSVDKAQDNMQKSAFDLDADKSADANAQQDDAIKALADATDAVKSQEKDLADKQNESASDTMKDLQALKDQIDKDKQLADSKTDPNLAKDIADQQQAAADLNPDVAADLEKAVKDLPQDQQDTSATSQDLADASQALQKQIDSQADAAKEDAALAQADSALAQAEQDAADAQAASQPGDQARDLAAAQQAAEQAAQSGALSDSAKGDAQSAADAFKNATNQSVQGNGQGAQEQTGQGMSALKSARSALTAARQSARQKGQMAMSQSMMPSDSDSMSLPPPSSVKTAASSHVIKAGDGSKGHGAMVVGALTTKDREAISQVQGQKISPEYSSMVHQYMKNLSDSDASSSN